MSEIFIDFLTGGVDETGDVRGEFLDSAVRSVEERVREELERCPEHDPLLLLSVEILRATDPESQWHDASLPRPLEDHRSPPLDASSPPSTADAPQRRDDASRSSLEPTIEVDAASGTADPAPTGPAPPDLDSDRVRRAARTFFDVLLENHRLPADLQMDAGDIRDVRGLLGAYFLRTGDVQTQVREMLSTIETKWNEGHFSQARILLKLFDADRQTRLEKDRTLFYEEMISRFGIERRHPLADETVEDYPRRGEDPENGDGDPEELREAVDWLAREVYVSMDVLGRPPEESERWAAIADRSARETSADAFSGRWPPEVWRRPDVFDAELVELIDAQLTERHVADYVIRHLETCFFILRAVGDTELEPYLEVYFDWIDEDFDVDGPAILPELHRKTTEGTELVAVIFDEVYRREFHEAVSAHRRRWDAGDVEAAVEGALERITATDPGRLPPGHYQFGGLVLDELFDLDYPSIEMRFKLHRLM